MDNFDYFLLSLSSRERGLKLMGLYGGISRVLVALFARAWIEINKCSQVTTESPSRSLRESVD